MSDQPDSREGRDVDLSAIGDTFKQLMGHMKGGIPVWEDFVARGMRFQKQMEQTITMFTSFMEGFSKIAELSIHSKATAGEIGAGLSSMVKWHKGKELKLREMNQALMGRLLAPLQGKIEEWKKTTTHFDREHEKEVQKAVKEIKEAAKTSLKVSKSLESKLKKDKPWGEKCNALQQQLEHCKQETERRLRETEERERRYLSRVLVEERTWFCGFVTAFSRVLDIEVGMIGDLERLQVILQDLGAAVDGPNQLPESLQEFVESWVIPSSPLSRKRGTIHAPVSSTHEITAPVAPPIPSLSSLPPPPPAPVPPPQTSHLPPPPSSLNPPFPTATSSLNAPFAPPPPTTGNLPFAPPPPTAPFAPPPPTTGNPPFAPPPPTAPFAPPPPTTGNPPFAPPTTGNPPFAPPPPTAVNIPYATSMDPYNGYAPVGVAPIKPHRPVSDELVPLATMSVSPSQASLMSSSSHQSTESSRSLSPPVAPTRSPVPSRAHLGGLQEEEPSSLQLEILGQLRQRTQSFDGPREPPPSITRAASMVVKPSVPREPTSSPLLGGRRPPPVASKPARNQTAANGRQSPHLGYAHSHHVLNPTSLSSQQDSDSDSDEQESALAKALKQKKLRKATQISDRSGPNIG